MASQTSQDTAQSDIDIQGLTWMSVSKITPPLFLGADIFASGRREAPEDLELVSDLDLTHAVAANIHTRFTVATTEVTPHGFTETPPAELVGSSVAASQAAFDGVLVGPLQHPALNLLDMVPVACYDLADSRYSATRDARLLSQVVIEFDFND